MKKIFIMLLNIILSVYFTSGLEKLNRGLIALQSGKKAVYIGWRYSFSDAKETVFELSKSPENMPKEEKVICKGALTNFIDKDIAGNEMIIYKLKTFVNGKQTGNEETFKIKTGKEPKPYIDIPLAGNYSFQQVTLADLDNDNELEFIIKQPNFNVDPYQKEGYWKKSEASYKIEAYKLNGENLWSYDLGWSIEEGIWYSPWIVYDLDGDGFAEVYCKGSDGNDYRNAKGLVETGTEHLVKIDGRTGKAVMKTDWISRDGYPDYNYASRNFLNIAFLDGKTPSLIMQRGTYNLIRTYALDKDFNIIWKFESVKNSTPNFWGQGAHTLNACDIDEDSFDEIVIGAAVLEENGKPKWSLNMGHPDIVYISDINPDNPGLEIFYGFEVKQKKNGICIADAKSGKILWGHNAPTSHIHGQGMFADIKKNHPGIEVLAGERDDNKRFLYSAAGELISEYDGLPQSVRALWWDNDPQKEVIIKNEVTDWYGKTHQKVEGSVIAVMDCFGDYREEVITSFKGFIRIYSTTILSDKLIPCLLEDSQYRKGIVTQSMGYYYPAQLSLKNSNMIN